MTEAVRIVCRGCGEWGYEEPDDPCPGLCPRCFNDLLHDQLARYLDDLDDRTLTDAEVFDRHARPPGRRRRLGRCSPPYRAADQGRTCDEG